MSRLESLPPDLHAVLSLLLRQRKSYAEVAGMLGIEARAVHDRAHAALALLAPREARELTAAERQRLGEYLLEQQAPGEQRETRELLEHSPAGRAWGQALAAELAPLAVQPLPEIPPPPAPSDAVTATPPQSSRVGGAVVLGVLAVAAIVVVLLIVGVGGGGSHGSTHPSASVTAPASSNSSGAGTTATSGGASTSGASTTPATSSSTSAGSTTPAAGTGGSSTTHGKALALVPPDPATSKAAGVAYVLTQNGKRAFYLFTKGLPVATGGTFYAVWLENSPAAPAYPLGSLPAQGANGLIEGGGALPSDASGFHHIIVTRETSKRPTHPGEIVLRGAFTLAG
jgi:hypothetical protein